MCPHILILKQSSMNIRVFPTSCSHTFDYQLPIIPITRVCSITTQPCFSYPRICITMYGCRHFQFSHFFSSSLKNASKAFHCSSKRSMQCPRESHLVDTCLRTLCNGTPAFFWKSLNSCFLLLLFSK